MKDQNGMPILPEAGIVKAKGIKGSRVANLGKLDVAGKSKVTVETFEQANFVLDLGFPSGRDFQRKPK
jgi:hypothetical protein